TGTTVSPHECQAGPAASPPAQYNDTVANKPTTGICPANAARTSGRKLAPCRATQVTTQRRFDPSQATAAGEIICRIAPAKRGIEAISPAAISPIPSARTNAGIYVSPMPTMTLNAAASETLLRRFLRSDRRRDRRSIGLG